jgi:hypothetical protein
LIRIASIATALILLAGLSSSADEEQDFTKGTSFRCLAPRTEPCFTHRGRLSAQNGIAYMIWLVGTHRLVGIDQTEIPEMLSKYLSMTSPDQADVYGNFEICPLEPERPGHMRAACVTGASRLVVQDRARSRPPLRLQSTAQRAAAMTHRRRVRADRATAADAVSRAEVMPLRGGEHVVFAVHNRPVEGTRGTYRVNLRHGVGRLRSGHRHTVGVIFHDAK